MVLAVILFTIFTSKNPQGPDTIPHRFVIYKPDISRAEITGSFSDWQPIPMTRLGSSGYWEAVLDLPRGEYRFSYILDGEQGIPDPTILTTENDDFGGKNSILYVSA